MSNLEAAGRALLGIEGPVIAQNYPESLTLDPIIHNTLIEAILTTRDGRERSVNFDFDGQNWVAGKIYRGTPNRVSRRYMFITDRRKVPIAAHTHPPVYPPSSSMAAKFRGRLLIGHDYQKSLSKEYMLDRAGRSTFSHGDIKALYLTDAGGGVANIVASEEGLFMAVFREFGWTRNSDIDSPRSVMREVMEAEEIDIRAHEEAEYCSNFNEIQTLICAGVAQAIANRFSSYFVNDPENPLLNRVE